MCWIYYLPAACSDNMVAAFLVGNFKSGLSKSYNMIRNLCRQVWVGVYLSLKCACLLYNTLTCKLIEMRSWSISWLGWRHYFLWGDNENCDKNWLTLIWWEWCKTISEIHNHGGWRCEKYQDHDMFESHIVDVYLIIHHHLHYVHHPSIQDAFYDTNIE